MAQKLKLHSPVGAEALILKWPVATSEGKEGPEEVVDTIRLVCEDFPELSTPLATRILKQGEDVSNYDYEQTKSLCERYNKAIDSIRLLAKGSPRLKQLSKKASRSQLKHILQQCYNQSVKDPEKLNHYEPFSPEVYGETSFELVEQMIKSVKFSDSDYFIDLGSGVGQVVLQVSAATNCKFCYGIEKAEWPAEYAAAMEKEFRKWMKWYGKEHGEFLIEKGDFLQSDVKDKLNKATIVFVNNFAFGPKVDHELKQRFANCLKEGARIVSSKAFCPLNFRITERNLSDIGTIMQVEELSPLCGAVSWTGKPFAYYVHTIDRTLLEKYFQRLRNPCKKDEVEPRKDRKGRPVQSIKDKINGGLSGASNGDATQDNGDKDVAKLLKQKKKKMKTVKRLNNGVIGKRQLQQKQGRKQKSKELESPPENHKAGFKLRPRQKQPLPESAAETRASRSVGGPVSATPAVASSNNHHPHHHHQQQHQHQHQQPRPSHSPAAVGSQPPSLDSLNLLHAHTVMSTSGKESVDSVHYNDRRMTETSSAYFKPTVQKQTVSMLEKQAGFLDMIENMKQRFLSFLTFMQTPQYRAMLLLQVEQEKVKNAELKAKTENLEKDISVLQKDGLGLIKDRLKEMGIKADSPRELLGQARDIVSSHQQLQAHTAALGAQITALQAEHSIKMTMYKKALDKRLPTRPTKNGLHESNQQALERQGSEQHQRLLMAGVDRLNAELQQLQDVNSNYTRPLALPSSAFAEGHRRDGGHTPLQPTGNSRRQGRLGVASRPALSAGTTNSFVLKEKLDMKENYDTFGEVLATLKQEISTIATNAGLTQQVKTEPKVERVPKSLTTPCTTSTSLSSSPSVPVSSCSTVSHTASNIHPRPVVQQHQSAQNLSSACLTSLASSAKALGGKELPLTTSAPSGTANSAAGLVLSGNGGSPSLTVASSSSWTTQPKSDKTSVNSSPRILPPGMKIDIKKPHKVGLNGIKSPPVSAARGKTKPTTGFTLLHSQSNGLVRQKAAPLLQDSVSLITSPKQGASYTDNEKSAAEDLISLKEGLSRAISSPVRVQQHQQQQQKPNQQQQQQQQHNIQANRSLVVNTSQPVTKSQSHATVKNPGTGRRAVFISKQYDSKAGGGKGGRGRSGSNAGSGTASQPIIVPECSSPTIMYAHTLVAAPSLATTQAQQAILTSPDVDLGKQQPRNMFAKSPPVLPNAVKIVSSLQHHPSNSITINNINKHKAPDHIVSLGPSSPKFRTLEPKCEGKRLSSLLASPSPSISSSPFHQSLPVTSDAGKSRSTVRHLLTAPTLTAVPLNASPSCPLAPVASTPSGAELLQYVTIQAPQHALAATSTQPGTNGAQPALMKLLQQNQQHHQNHNHHQLHQHQQQQQLVQVSPKAASNTLSSSRLPPPSGSSGGAAANSSNSSNSSKGSSRSALTSPVVGQAAGEDKGQAVKLVPPNGFDGKDWWILVMQSNQQAGNPAAPTPPQAQHLGGSVLNGQPQ